LAKAITYRYRAIACHSERSEEPPYFVFALAFAGSVTLPSTSFAPAIPHHAKVAPSAVIPAKPESQYSYSKLHHTFRRAFARTPSSRVSPKILSTPQPLEISTNYHPSKHLLEKNSWHTSYGQSITIKAVDRKQPGHQAGFSL
jgi:hypothetical protein